MDKASIMTDKTGRIKIWKQMPSQAVTQYTLSCISACILTEYNFGLICTGKKVPG